MYKLRIVPFLSVLLFGYQASFGQLGNQIIKDSRGNSYVAGNFSDKFVNFGKFRLENKGRTDIFLAKYDMHGKILWAKNIGGKEDEKLCSIKIDKSDNISVSASSLSKEIYASGSLFLNTSEDKIFDTGFNSNGNLIHTEVIRNSSLQKSTQDDTSLTLTSPEAGDTWKVGTKGIIKWQSQNISNVLIELSTDNGLSWDQLYVAEIFGIENLYDFVVPNIHSDLCIIRISDYDNPDVADTSGLFSISGKLFWEVKETEFSSILFSSFISDSVTCWMAGLDGLVKTSDHGLTWTSYLNGYGLLDIFFLNDSIGWTVGLSGVIFKTINGGADWVEQDSLINSYLLHVFFVDEASGYILGDNNFLKTTNGGESWEIQQPTEHTLMSMFFIDKNTGWIAGNEGVILKTTDAGVSWDVQQSNGTQYGTITSLNFIDENLGFASGSGLDVNGGVILKTTDGGENWNLMHNGFNRFVFSVQFVTENLGWAAGDEGIMFSTSNGGDQWELQGSGTLNDLLSVNINSNYTGWAAGNGIILTYNPVPIDPPLPVELTGFEAVNKNGEVLLNWSTATEINNRGFEIEKKLAGNWMVIGFVRGRGTSTVYQSYTFSEKNLTPGNHLYRLKQINYDGTFEYSKILSVMIASRFSFKLEQNYPNPFNPATAINFSLAENVPVSLKIYDILGNELVCLVNEEKPAGDYVIKFNAAGYSTGTYFYVLKAGNFVQTRKMLLIK